MKYTIYQLSFPNGIHIGDKSLEESNYTISADTLFSALYIEALKREDDIAERLLEGVQNGTILLSDTFPYIGKTNYLPKPLLRIESEHNKGDSVIKKAFKGLSYIPMEKMEDYIQGKFDAVKEKAQIEKLGQSVLKTAASINGKVEADPYYIGVYYFNDDCGLYFILGHQFEDDEEYIYELIDALSFSGIGGKKSSGLGHFEVKKRIEVNCDCFEKESENYMSLSIGLSQNEELEKVLEGAQYQLQKRSGFVYSSDYALEQRKKKDIFMFSAGSCFKEKFSGNIYDVSDGGMHAVYRYGKPIFWAL